MSSLPAVNAGLNGMAFLVLVTGYYLIKRRRIIAHRNAMIGAFGLSTVFLISYVTHYVWRATVMGGTHTPYGGEGWLAVAYYSILVTHVILAMAVPVLAVWMLVLGFRREDSRHRFWGRITLPIWLYVSVTGVVIYLMLYPFNPA